MRKKFILLVSFLLLSFSSKGQYYLGFHSSNWAGIASVHMQPADIVDSRMKFDAILIGWDFQLANSYIGLDRWTVFNWGAFQDTSFKDKYLKEYLGQEAHNVYFSTQWHLPSFMLTLSEKDAIGFSGRLRAMVNVDDIDEPLARHIYRSLKDSLLWKTTFSDDNVSVQVNTWAEYGATYGRVIMDEGQHFLKGAMTVKLLQGLGSAYFFIKDFKYNFTNDDTLSVFQTEVNYGHSDNFELNQNNIKYRFEAYPTLGADFGIVYEWRPHYEKYKYDMDGKTGLWRRDLNKYKLKFAIALTDLGRMRYKKAPLSANFKADIQNWDINPLDSIKSVQQFDQMVDSMFTYEQDEGFYKMSLPTALNTQIDFRLTEGLALNFTAFWAFMKGTKDIDKTHFMTTYTLTPRAENAWFGVYVPINYIPDYTDWNIGFGFRLGPFVFGSYDMLGQLIGSSQYIRGASWYGMTKIPIPYGPPRDFDNDKVSDKLDECYDVPGVWMFKGCPDTDKDSIPDSEDDCPLTPGLLKFKGCPDTDGDGIMDKEDNCPNTPGLKEFNGCPDTDGDGIMDKEDRCPNEKGLKEFQGCPDSDGDSIPDYKDECPTKHGLIQFNGCPDTDGDGLEDRIDKCPTAPGPKEKFGCPDSDGDGLYDYEDKCPDLKGPVENKGCPYADTDGDGVRDIDDACPTVPGPAQNKGCPESDRDGDGVRDIDDACPDIPGKPELKGCPDADSDGDGIRDIDDACPHKPGPIENKGCPYTDTDGDSVPDIRDKCPNTPGPVKNNGCPELKKEEKEILKTAFENLEFETASAKIRPSSYASLIDLARLLKKKPKWRLLIEGHTDNVGSREYNIKLSKRRAEAVKKFLMEQGVEGDRIITKGYGPDKPIAPNDTPEGRQKNRRVEFTILFD